MKKLLIFLLMVLPLAGLAAKTEKVTIKKDESGFRLMVDKEPYEVKGVVWSYTPIGEKYTYDLWRMPDQFIKDMIDRDAALMKEIGVNTIRVFSDVPPRWIEYFYYQHGIHTIVNYLFGRYGMEVRGKWHPDTDYSDWYTRLAIQEEALAAVEEYKDTDGVLMFLFGNENNYGLEWDSGKIENLPVGQQMEMRAGYLYSLYEETISVAKSIDANHPMGIVNGDIQYLNIIEALVPSLDILGVNTYRGSEAYDLFYQSIKNLGVPFLFTELGADAWNASTQTEDQYHQALYIRNQWREIYEQSWGKGNYQNSLGGFVFEWMDEWWKHGLDTNLDIHDTEGSWTNGGYSFDAAPGVDNMNEEWFGIIAQSELKKDEINRRIPRAAFYMLGDIWKLSLYDSSAEEVGSHFDRIDPARYLALGEPNVLKNENKEKAVSIKSLKLDAILSESFTDADLDAAESASRSPLSALEMNHSEELSLTLEFNPLENLSGDVTVKFRGNVYNPLFYTELENQEIAELYSASFQYGHDYFDINGYYHTGLADWYLEGDFFNMMPESWDLYHMDIEGSDAPYGLMFSGKESLEGLKIYAGPEIYRGARPQAMAKYYRNFSEDKFDWGLSTVLQQDFNVTDKEAPYSDPSQGASLYGYFSMYPWFRLDAGAYWAGADKIGDTYSYTEPAASGTGYLGSDWNLIENNEITFADTLSGKVELTTNLIRYTKIYGTYTYAGLVAGTNPMIPRGGFFKADTGSGNRHEITAGFQTIFHDFTLDVRGRYRKPLIDTLAPGLGVSRNPLSDPFHVFYNRETAEAELVLTFDPTGATWFHEWNSFDIEDAPFAASLSLLYTFFAGATDPTSYINDADALAIFAAGLPESNNNWAAKLTMVTNPLPLLKIGLNYHIGYEQSLGEDTRMVSYMGGGLKARYGKLTLDSSVEWNGWGPETWYREFNITYPWQWKVDLAYSFDIPSFFNSESKIGAFWQGKTFGEYSADDEPDSGYLMEIGLYSSISY